MKKVVFVVGLLCAGIILGGGENMIYTHASTKDASGKSYLASKYRFRVKENMLVKKDYEEILNPEELQDAKEIEMQKSFINHPDQIRVILDAGGRKISQNQLKKIIELNKLKELSIENADIQEISLSQAVKLEILTIKNCMHLERLDVKGAKKLKKIIVENAPVKKLNLEKNKKLQEVSVQSGLSCVLFDFTKQEAGKVPVFPWSDYECKIQFPKKNRIVKLNYFTTDNEIDVSRCRNLKEVHMLKYCKIKTENQWYKKNGKKLVIYADGIRQKKLSVKRNKNIVLLRARKVKDKNMEYYFGEEEEIVRHLCTIFAG